jgi:hypothetical protein
MVSVNLRTFPLTSPLAVCTDSPRANFKIFSIEEFKSSLLSLLIVSCFFFGLLKSCFVVGFESRLKRKRKSSSAKAGFCGTLLEEIR